VVGKIIEWLENMHGITTKIINLGIYSFVKLLVWLNRVRCDGNGKEHELEKDKFIQNIARLTGKNDTTWKMQISREG